MRGDPPGIVLVRSFRSRDWSVLTYRYVVLIVTFIAYTSYHASRKPSSIVKSVLHSNNLDGMGRNVYPWPVGDVFSRRELVGVEGNVGDETGWAPFDGEDGTSKLGEIDVAFLACYSMGMYVAGHLGDTLDLRLFLTGGMIGSGVFVGLFGMGYFWNVHAFWFYLVMQYGCGIVSSNGGSLLAAGVLEYGWGWSFIVPGAFIFVGGVIVYFFLAAYPEDVGFPFLNGSGENDTTVPTDVEALQNELKGAKEDNRVRKSGSGSRKSIKLLEACMIPGVIPFALCLFFAKLVAYTFLYWLPFYLSRTAIGGEYMSVKSAGNLSTLFDVGGIVGGILAGYISDKLKARATTAATFMYAAIPSMILYRIYGNASTTMNILLMMTTGLFVNGPYALITTAVSADLGTHSSVRGDSRALATVTAIIDGTGSLGAALGPLLTGFLSTKGWNFVFGMLSLGALIAGLLLSRLVIAEIAERAPKPVVSGQHYFEADASQELLHDQRR
ncbi:putative glycerol-3-phosphate transporter 4 [Heracleum sosnowskyi]|uniref:Glycerol-3-phosphate transporter 4 n=1 Tax=Heracleum sosnowskyi TaxID=360622 RepID=A0AAD8HIX3_9APIA|nr:putative glycerol-3-phosphate transporter 4 [Heracleum sosnowskyi]